MSKVLDAVWMPVDKRGCVCYIIGGTRKELIEACNEQEPMGTGLSWERMKARGFRAKRVVISLADPRSLREAEVAIARLRNAAA